MNKNSQINSKKTGALFAESSRITEARVKLSPGLGWSEFHFIIHFTSLIPYFPYTSSAFNCISQGEP